MQTVHGGSASSFTYGADGLRRSATVDGVTTKYLLDGQNVVQEIGPAGRITTLWGPRGPEARIAPDGSALWYVYDAHGNVLAEVDEQGHINPDQNGLDTAIRDFDPWGFVRNPQDVADNGNPLKYCGTLGHPSENNTGLIYMRARYYDPQTGRFISEDPAKDGGNWFAYAGGNPVAGYDITGRTMSFEQAGRMYYGGVALSAVGALGMMYSAQLAAVEGCWGCLLQPFAGGLFAASSAVYLTGVAGMAAGVTGFDFGGSFDMVEDVIPEATGIAVGLIAEVQPTSSLATRFGGIGTACGVEISVHMTVVSAYLMASYFPR